MIFDLRFMLLDLPVMNRLQCFTLVIFLLVLSLHVSAQDTYRLHYFFVDKDTTFTADNTRLETSFNSIDNCRAYLGKAIADLRAKGYINASLDSTVFENTSAAAWIYLGEQYRWTGIIPTAPIKPCWMV